MGRGWVRPHELTSGGGRAIALPSRNSGRRTRVPSGSSHSPALQSAQIVSCNPDPITQRFPVHPAYPGFSTGRAAQANRLGEGSDDMAITIDISTGIDGEWTLQDNGNGADATSEVRDPNGNFFQAIPHPADSITILSRAN